MNKIIIINTCEDCPFFDNEYYSYNERCTQLERVIEQINNHYCIPEDCPLETTDEKVTEYIGE